MSRPAAVVIGAGANELVAAHSLARARCRVVVLEERTATDGARDDIGWIAPQIARALALHRHGLTIDRLDPWIAAPLPDGGRLELWHDIAR